MTKKLLALMILVATCVACGGGGSGSSSPTSATPPTASAVVTARGNGFLEVHPSLLSAWCCALVTPIRLTETAGGKADWVFARLSLYKNGREIERSERGSDYLSSPPDWTKIEANSSYSYDIVFRINSSDFDSMELLLGFNDRVSGRAFTVNVPFSTFSGVRLSLVPLSQGSVALKD